MNDKDKDKELLSIRVAELYYQLNNSQQEIASKLDISRPTVSRLLQYAKDKGYVQIKVTTDLWIWKCWKRNLLLSIN